jgi:hypothetical protein
VLQAQPLGTEAVCCLQKTFRITPPWRPSTDLARHGELGSTTKRRLAAQKPLFLDETFEADGQEEEGVGRPEDQRRGST